MKGILDIRYRGYTLKSWSLIATALAVALVIFELIPRTLRIGNLPLGFILGMVILCTALVNMNSDREPMPESEFTKRYFQYLLFTLPVGCAAAYGILALTPLLSHPQPVWFMFAIGALWLSFLAPLVFFDKEDVHHFIEEMKREEAQQAETLDADLYRVLYSSDRRM